ncbi:MAG: tetratricopeptide repeat protein [Myxococcota bacterium]|nr:tetratricopeptide repeat protein [Myxococcota bacterium]
MRLFVVGVAMAVLFQASAAFADARQHFLAGQDYYTQGRYEKAIEEFDEAYRLDPKPLLLFNISQAHERLGRVDKAIEYLEQYLKADPNTANAKALKDKIANLKSKVQATGLAITCNVDGATILVDNKEMGVTPLKAPLGLAAGTHRIKLVRPGYRDFLMTVAVTTGQTIPIDATLEPDPTAKAGAAVAPSQSSGGTTETAPQSEESQAEEEDKGPSKLMDILPWVVAGVGGATAIVGWGVVGSLAKSNNDTGQALTADIIGIAGSAVLAGGAIWGIVHLVKKKKGERSETPTAMVVPILSPSTTGLGASFTF